MRRIQIASLTLALALLAGVVWAIAPDTTALVGPQSDPTSANKLLLLGNPTPGYAEPFIMWPDRRHTPAISRFPLGTPGTPAPVPPVATPVTIADAASFCVLCAAKDTVYTDVVYAGGVGVTAATGIPLAPGDCTPAWPAIDGSCNMYGCNQASTGTQGQGACILIKR